MCVSVSVCGNNNNNGISQTAFKSILIVRRFQLQLQLQSESACESSSEFESEDPGQSLMTAFRITFTQGKRYTEKKAAYFTLALDLD